MAPTPDHSGGSDQPAPRTSRPIAVLLAAGGGSRFRGAGHKLLATLPASADRPAESVFARSLSAIAPVLVDGTLEHLVVVTGAAELGDELAAAVTRLGIASSVTARRNERWADGQATSLRLGLHTAEAIGGRIVVVGLADQPDSGAATWRSVAAAATAADATPITTATYSGRPRTPVALHRSVWPLLPSEGDEGARELIRVRPELVTEVPSGGSPADIDTVEDLRRWQNI